jgi:Flp pilus assembly protein CpaB
VRRSWSRSSKLYLTASAVLALLTGIRIHAFAERAGEAATAEGRRVRVLVVSAPIARGEAVTADRLRVASMPSTYAPPGAITSISRAAGRVALTDLAAGEVMTDTRLARVRAGPVASLVPQGLRAFAVPTSLPGGLVGAGDRVDVLATYQGGQPHTELVVSGVEVLFTVGGPEGEGSGGIGGLDLAGIDAHSPTVLIVLVAPQQEERLAFARAFANLEVVLVPADEPYGASPNDELKLPRPSSPR